MPSIVLPVNRRNNTYDDRARRRNKCVETERKSRQSIRLAIVGGVDVESNRRIKSLSCVRSIVFLSLSRTSQFFIQFLWGADRCEKNIKHYPGGNGGEGERNADHSERSPIGQPFKLVDWPINSIKDSDVAEMIRDCTLDALTSQTYPHSYSEVQSGCKSSVHQSSSSASNADSSFNSDSCLVDESICEGIVESMAHPYLLSNDGSKQDTSPILAPESTHTFESSNLAPRIERLDLMLNNDTLHSDARHFVTPSRSPSEKGEFMLTTIDSSFNSENNRYHTSFNTHADLNHDNISEYHEVNGNKNSRLTQNRLAHDQNVDGESYGIYHDDNHFDDQNYNETISNIYHGNGYCSDHSQNASDSATNNDSTLSCFPKPPIQPLSSPHSNGLHAFNFEKKKRKASVKSGLFFAKWYLTRVLDRDKRKQAHIELAVLEKFSKTLRTVTINATLYTLDRIAESILSESHCLLQRQVKRLQQQRTKALLVTQKRFDLRCHSIRQANLAKHSQISQEYHDHRAQSFLESQSSILSTFYPSNPQSIAEFVPVLEQHQWQCRESLLMLGSFDKHGKIPPLQPFGLHCTEIDEDMLFLRSQLDLTTAPSMSPHLQ